MSKLKEKLKPLKVPLTLKDIAALLAEEFVPVARGVKLEIPDSEFDQEYAEKALKDILDVVRERLKEVRGEDVEEDPENDDEEFDDDEDEGIYEVDDDLEFEDDDDATEDAKEGDGLFD